MSKATGLLTDPVFLRHDTGQHPERIERLVSVLDYLKQTDLWNRLEIVPAEKADLCDIHRIHDPNYVAGLESEIKGGVPFIGSMDCAVCPETFDVALRAAGGALSLTRKVLNGELKNGFGLVRPPGHHAEKGHAMGFCYFNNIAVCAEYLVKAANIERVLIVDFDVHHGNGTQHSFEDRSDIFYCSIHEDPRVCFPGTGHGSETGRGAGDGYTLNVPVPSFSGDEEYREKLDEVFIPAWEKFKPGFVLISAGFDAHKDDPLARVNVTSQMFADYTTALRRIAEDYAGGKIVSLLEGGYNLSTLPILISEHLENLAAAS